MGPASRIWRRDCVWRHAGRSAGPGSTAAALVNELVEAKQSGQVRRVMARWRKYDVIVLDEVGYVPLADVGAEFLFQVISERAERAAVIVTIDLPFSEWTTVFPNPRLCKALLDHITDRAHIIETGTIPSGSGGRWKREEEALI
ncbi:MAG: ATP-binding protein [Bryobacteraceae bacterium]